MDSRISEHILSVGLKTVGARFMKKVNRRSLLSCLAVALITSSPVLVSAESILTLENEQYGIMNIYGAPIGIQSKLEYGACHVFSGVLPMQTLAALEREESMVIKVEGEKDISILCKGKDGVVITRD